MAEALTVIEVALCITEIVERLCEYVSAVKNAKDDIRKLTQELLALKGALDHIHAQNKGDLVSPLQHQAQSMLKMTQDTLDAMSKKLGTPKSSSLGRAVQSLAWPFRAGDVEKYLATVERAKTWFIMVLMQDSLDTTSSVLAEMRNLSAMVHEDIIARQTDRMLEETADLLKWLSPVNSEDKLRSSAADWLPGTGQWIQSGRFAVWESGHPTEWPIFWISGRSGSGKTVLFSHLVGKLRARLDNVASEKHNVAGLAFHCCSLDDAASQNVANVFGSILAQIGAVRPEILDHVRPLRTSGSNLIPQNNLSIEQIYELMDYALEPFDVFYLLVDGLNETSHEARLVTALLTLCERHGNLRVLVTCTRNPAQPSPRIFIRDMSTKAIDLDIDMYVQDRLSTEQSFQGLSPKIRGEIRTKIVSDANGTFRWAKLCIDKLSTLRTGRDVRRVLKDIPSTLNETYAGILNRIPEQDRQIAYEALMWLCFSLRPLRLEELAEAVIMEEDDTHIDGDCRLTDPCVIARICQGLVHVSNRFVVLAHDSIRTFLQSDWIRTSSAAVFALDAGGCHRRMMRKCIAYLNLEPFTSGPVKSFGEVMKRFAAFPLLDYASSMWPMHSERFPLEEEDERIIIDFFATKKRPDGGPFEAWVQFLLRSGNFNIIRDTEPLYYAASFNMTSILKVILKPEYKVDVDKKGGRFSSPPVFVAIWRRNIEAAKLLLRAGANPDTFDSSGQNSRWLAMERGMNDVVDLMNEMKPVEAWRSTSWKRTIAESQVKKHGSQSATC